VKTSTANSTEEAIVETETEKLKPPIRKRPEPEPKVDRRVVKKGKVTKFLSRHNAHRLETKQK
jgi:hypothetical protein